ncbi:trypsin-like serine peptidase [Chryseobacterium arthrosphaerae]|uniref:trypsin-like serine peptidase n=1 Tax=Chryseobacterium arthrosphaerae TaxID=651561 RepID=UPI001F4A2615|nr:serine protease [Chryseobacterium arthrosphaerae]
MAWSKKLTQLNDVLSDLVPYKNGITKYINASGLKPQYINMDGSAMDAWNNVLSEADKHSKVDELVKSVLQTYPENPFLKSALSPNLIDYSLSPDIDEISKWQDISEDTLEVLTTEQSTMLPVNFLAKGVLKSKAVGKIEIQIGNSSTSVGTGFLFKIEGVEELFFITNYHVINDKKRISKTKIIFDYELDTDGNSVASKSFKINGTGPWYCSPVHEYDATIFQLVDEKKELDKYGYLELKDVDVEKNNFVNIVQHPGGQMKQISLYHNIVTNTTDRVVQYLTDTLKGSSGSPVFNSDWEVVALHHSGGGYRLGEPQLPDGFKSRNEGIFINRIIQFFKENHKN